MDWKGGLKELMIEYFNGLFASSESNWNPITSCIDRKITEEQNESMLKLVEDREVKQAIFHIHYDKSPGPDGMSPGFYHKYWTTVRGDVI